MEDRWTNLNHASKEDLKIGEDLRDLRNLKICGDQGGAGVRNLKIRDLRQNSALDGACAKLRKFPTHAGTETEKSARSMAKCFRARKPTRATPQFGKRPDLANTYSKLLEIVLLRFFAKFLGWQVIWPIVGDA